jgi:hypothetical protein
MIFLILSRQIGRQTKSGAYSGSLLAARLGGPPWTLHRHGRPRPCWDLIRGARAPRAEIRQPFNFSATSTPGASQKFGFRASSPHPIAAGSARPNTLGPDTIEFRPIAAGATTHLGLVCAGAKWSLDIRARWPRRLDWRSPPPDPWWKA